MIDDNSREFIRRHIGPSEEDIKKMLKVVGANSLDDLVNKTVPENILLKDKLKIGDPTSEHESMKQVKVISEKNKKSKGSYKLPASFTWEGLKGDTTNRKESLYKRFLNFKDTKTPSPKKNNIHAATVAFFLITY